MSKIIRIISLIDGFRRAGMAHSKTPTDHPEDAFSKAQIAALQAEPKLSVQLIDAPVIDTIGELLKGKVSDVVARLADASDELRTQALEVEQAQEKPRQGVLKALGVEEK